MCSWCWAFRPTLTRLLTGLPATLSVKRLLGGLAADTDAPMSDDMREYLVQTWQKIQHRVPGTEFNFDFWDVCRPRRSTYPACRAVIAARRQDPACEDRMIFRIQRGYYTEARNPSDVDVLVAFSAEIGLETSRFLHDLQSVETAHTLGDEIAETHRIGARFFPSLFLELGDSIWPISVDYRDANAMQTQVLDLLGS